MSHGLTDDQIIQKAISILEARAAEIDGYLVTNPDAAKQLARLHIGSLEHEVFGVFHLTNQHALIEFQVIFRGTISSASVYPREVVKEALARNSAALVLCHNHPSGVVEPSAADQRITEQLVKALDLVDIRVIDHVICSTTDALSFAERGII